jgi:hypothetical protein
MRAAPKDYSAPGSPIAARLEAASGDALLFGNFLLINHS